MGRIRLPRWLKILLIVIAVLLIVVLALLIGLGWYVKSQMLDSGGELKASMAAYDVRHYDLAVAIDPATRAIHGKNVVTVEVVDPIDEFEIDLDDRLEVDAVSVDGAASKFSHRNGVIRVGLASPWAPGDRRSIAISYGGKPKVALRPPWIDGFVWSQTPSGAPWVGVTGEGDGGDNWWPCKDHPSDEPDEGMHISLTVPSDLIGLANGRFEESTENGDGTTTSHWTVSFPINNYLVTVNVAPYVPIEERYFGVKGDLDLPLVFWSLPEYADRARVMWRQMPVILEVFGRRFGEYPFFSDKFAVAHAPYYGMEHQTLVAYGAEFSDNEYHFDDLLLHEVAHEWWGNKITAADWADFWLHEGFATYAEALFVDDTLGEERYLDYMRHLARRVRNRRPIVRGTNLTSFEAYSGDIYFKGAWILHTLRFLLGDEAFFEVLWRFADGDHPEACHLVSTDDLIALVGEVSGLELAWFWDRYLYRAEPPRWRVERRAVADGEDVEISWDDEGFELPLPVRVGDTIRRVAMPGGHALLTVAVATEVEVDPERRVLADWPD